MSENKENLKLLLKFIEKIIDQEENNWFHDELALLFSKKIISEKDTGIKLSAVTIKEIGSIDKYLDEGIIPIIDYSEISDKKVRLQLERDSIEMGKARLSNYSGKISFENFCKYAHFQSEELVNYYFVTSSNNDVETVKNDIINYTNIKIDKLSDNSSISSIPHSFKQWAISNKISIEKKNSYILKNIANVRNLEIHRNSAGQIDLKIMQFIKYENYNQIYEAIVYLKNKVIENLDR